MREKRANVRIPLGVEAQFQFIRGVDAPGRVLTRDIGLGGVHFSAAERLDPGQALSFTLLLPEVGQVHLTGVVVWVRESGQGGGGLDVGLRWAQIGPVGQKRLKSFLTRRIPSAAADAPAVPLAGRARKGRLLLYASIGLLLALVAWSLWSG